VIAADGFSSSPPAQAAAADKAGSRSDRDLLFLAAHQQRDLIVKKEISSVELTEAALRRIEALDGKLHAFVTVDRDGALQAAKAADAAVRQAKSPQELGPLHGVPISIKDLEMTKGLRTTFGSLVYKDFVPDYDSIVVERVRKAGAVILGKTNSPEFGLNAETYNRLLPDCANPWDATRTAGGSSGGAAASVASGMCALATGSDGGGSTRIPCHFTGTYGIKVTLGRIPRYGGVGKPAVNVTSNSGPIARTVRDAALLLQVLSGHDSRDPGALRQKPPDFLAALKGKGSIKGMKVGWSLDLGFAPVEPDVATAVRDAVKVFGSLQAEVTEAGLKLDPPPFEFWAPIWYSNVKAAYGHLMDQHVAELMPYVIAQIHRGTKVTGDDYSRALRLRDVLRSQLDDYFEKFDLLVLPSVAVTAFPFRNPPKAIGGKPVLKTEAGLSFGVFPFTPAFNLSGHPAASIPCGFDRNGLPIGLQIVASFGNEAAVLRASAAFEEAKPWAAKRPPVS
jgi:aspartyl-tRNA(Asn)/glutamyl-tRNA(Gln) amidotransferase subunit A